MNDPIKMEVSTITPHIEALIFASDKPLSTLELLELVNNALAFIDDKASADQVESAIEDIREKYASDLYSFEMKESGGGWQFLTKKEFHKTIAQLNADKYLKKLSVASLETLAIIAYKQPVTKSEIENIRGVNCDYAVQKLLEKELVIIAGRNEDAVGKPLIYATSKSFMDYFGINGPEDLPKIREVLMEELVEATKITEESAEELPSHISSPEE
jgi:segregation and condensation protein B